MAKYNLVQAVIDRDDFQPPEDVCVCTMHIRHQESGLPDLFDLDHDDRTQFHGNWVTFWTAIRPHVSGALECRELRFYDVPANPGELMGDPVDVLPVALKGSAGSQLLPPQCAVSVTWRTVHRLRWGRFYLPGFTVTSLGPFGRLEVGVRTTIAEAAAGLANQSGDGATLTVFSRKFWNHEDPQNVQVDDIIDVVRRRRFDKPIARTIVGV